MTQEEKARAYDEALKLARDYHEDKNCFKYLKGILENIFPEIQESDDERINREITEFIVNFHNGNYEKPYDYTIGTWLAWLEKQGNHADKIEPKFKNGQWIVFNGLTLYVNEVVQGYYRTTSIGGIPNSYDWNIDNAARLWTIQEAKDGDVLACEKSWTCIFKTLVNDENFSSYCFMDNTEWFCETGSECHTLREEFIKAYNGKIYPATKEQRDLLFQKMKEAGYDWDAEKKELRKIEEKPKWTEEDDTYKLFAISAIEDYYDGDNPLRKDLVDWLKDIKQRLTNEKEKD